MKLDEAFAPYPVPEWLLAFEADPEEAVNALLWKRFYFGPLNVEEPEELLIDWAILLADDEDFQARLDGALALWIDRTWGEIPDLHPARLAEAWTALAHVIANLDGLPITVQALREVFPDRDEYLGPLSVSPSQDPLGCYLGALAAHQADRSLAPLWWHLCELPERVPFYHAVYAMAGLLGLPALVESEAGGFREEAARGLAKLAKAFDRLVERQEIEEKRAEEEILSIGRLAMAGLPFQRRWREALEGEISRLPARAARWMGSLIPDLSGKKGKTELGPELFEVWKKRAASIEGALERGRVVAIREAETLLAEQEHHAQISGDTLSTVLSLMRFARSIWEWDPQRAVQWADRARIWEPENIFLWMTLVQALLRAQGPSAALLVAWEATVRFPESSIARTGLAETLKTAGRLQEAEEVYREAAERSPDNPTAQTGLVEVPRFVPGRIREAPPEVGIRASRRGRVAWTSEARFLRHWARRGGGISARWTPEALRRRAGELLDRVLDIWAYDLRALAEKGLLLADSGQLEEARALLVAALEHMPGAPILAGALARVERERAQREFRPYTELSAAEVQEPSMRLRALNPVYEPLTHLQRGRAILALQDGHARLAGAARELDQLHRWMRPHLAPSQDTFQAWWSQGLEEHVFSPFPVEASIGPEDVAGIADRIERNRRQTDMLEEDFLNRLSLPLPM